MESKFKYVLQDPDDIPERKEFITNKKLSTNLENRIKNNDEIFFIPISVYDSNLDEKYIIKLFGPLIDGSKAEIRITGIPVYFDILIDIDNKNDFNDKLISILNESYINFWLEDVEKYPLMGYTERLSQFKRIFVNNVFTRKKLLKRLNEKKYNLYSNDTSYYYRKAARELKLNLSQCASLTKYTYVAGPTRQSPMSDHVITLDYRNYKDIDDTVKSLPFIIKDNTLLCSWDIETYSRRETGELPNANYEEDTVFMICLSVHWVHNPEAEYKLCITDKECKSDDWSTIVCKTEKEIIEAFIIALQKFKPDIMIGFNDSKYDWPFVMKKIIQYDLLVWFFEQVSSVRKNWKLEEIESYRYSEFRIYVIKIANANDFLSNFPLIDGLLLIDCRAAMIKLTPKIESSSLNSFLKMYGLEEKVDLKVTDMWKYYKSNDPDKMKVVAYYCIIDTISVQRLFVTCKTIVNYRELTSLAHTTLFDVHYNAIGIRVINLIYSYAYDNNILVQSKIVEKLSDEDENALPKIINKNKYPGAYVFNPDKGITPSLNNIDKLLDIGIPVEEALSYVTKDKPVVCFDFASLYPSLIINYNLSPEKIVFDKSNADILIGEGYNLHHISFDYDSKPINAWSIRHDNNTDNYGLFPKLLSTLFLKRKELKKDLKIVSEKIELYSFIKSRCKDSTLESNINIIIKEFNEEIENLRNVEIIISPGSTYDDEKLSIDNRINLLQYQLNILGGIDVSTFNENYDTMCYSKNYINSKQNTLKVYMNSFYGESGNKISPFFLLPLAGGITTAGRDNIKMVANYVTNNNFHVKYGDSVMPYVPIVVRRANFTYTITFENLMYEWTPFGEDKEQIVGDDLPEMYIWSKNGWTIIKRFIRHKCVKKIYRIISNSGIVDVTEDHSLIDINNNYIKPTQCNKETILLTNKIKLSDEIVQNKCVRLGSEFVCSTPSMAQQTCCKIWLSGYEPSIDYVNNYRIIAGKKVTNGKVNSVKLLYNNYDGYVYDVETEDGTFCAGVGSIIIKNTDSLYLTFPQHYYRNYDLKYRNRECDIEEYYSALVRITILNLQKVENDINQFIKNNTGSDTLKMENEGCTFPCIFLGKKKYFGISHTNEVNFHPEKLYIKGIDVIKKNQADMTKKIGHRIMNISVSLTNRLSIKDIVKTVLQDSINSSWDFENFILRASWRPKAQNQSVQTFMRRMRVKHEMELRDNENRVKQGLDANELMYQPIEPGERFDYVIIKPNNFRDTKGRKIHLQVGNMMEYSHVAKKLNYEVYVSHYIANYVTGVCARFINSDDEFNLSLDPDLPLGTIDTVTYTAAKKYLKNYVDQLEKNIIISPEEVKIMKDNFKYIMNSLTINRPFIRNVIEGPLNAITFDMKPKDEEDCNINSYIEMLINVANKQARSYSKKYDKYYCKQLCILLNINSTNGSDIGDVDKSLNLYKYINNVKNNNTNFMEYEVRKTLSNVIDRLRGFSIEYKASIIDFIENIDKIEDNGFDSIDYTNIEDFINAWPKLFSIQLYTIRKELLYNFLSDIKFKRTNSNINMKQNDIKKIIDNIV